MYQVFQPPFPFVTSSRAHTVLAKVTLHEKPRYRILIQGVSSCLCGVCRPTQIDWFESVASDLNSPPSKEFKNLLLLSIEDTWKLPKERLKLPRQRTDRSFRADFGRMDIGQRQGFGRD